MIVQMPRFARHMWLALITLTMNGWVLTALSWAASAPQEEIQEKNYVPAYIIVIMAVVLGLTAICRMGKRSADIRRPTT